MDVYYYFNYFSTAWMCLEALPLITAPTLITTVLSPELREPTPLEEYLSRSLGIVLISFSILNLVLTGSIPLVSTFAVTATAKGASSNVEDPTAPYAVPSLTITLAYHVATATYCYAQWNLGYSDYYGIAVTVHGFLAAMGGWVLLFGASNGNISRKTGADGGTSGFPFKDVEADKKKLRKVL
ncbi:hypothetical protein RUND412_007786 [Rhizina undulata]